MSPQEHMAELKRLAAYRPLCSVVRCEMGIHLRQIQRALEEDENLDSEEFRAEFVIFLEMMARGS